MLNLRSIISDKAIIALLSLAAMIPMVTGKIDLTVGYGIVLWHILAISLQTVLRRALAGGGADRARARRAASGCSTACWSRSRRSTASSRRSAPAPCSTRSRSGTRAAGRSSACCRKGFLALNGTMRVRPADHRLLRARPRARAVVRARTPADRPLPLRHRRQPEGGGAERHPGARASPSRPSSPRACSPASPACCSPRSCASARRASGSNILLPALVGAFLGSTTIKPGRVNVWGTLVGVAILAIGISGIQQFGGSFWVEPLFNGVTLLVAIGIAGYAQRRRGARRAARSTKGGRTDGGRRSPREERP